MSEVTRIDYSKYEVDEVAETIADAIFFPMYIGKVVGQVVLIFLGLLILFSFLTISNNFLALLFILIVFAISVPSMLLFSVIRLFSTIRDDINNVFRITVETTVYVIEDTGILRDQRKTGAPIKHTFSDVFKGVALYVIRPSLKRVLTRRIKYFAGPLAFLMDGIFKRTIVKRPPDLDVTVDEEGHVHAAPATTADKIKQGTKKTTTVAFGVVKFPFRLTLVIYGFFNFLIAWGLWAILS